MLRATFASLRVRLILLTAMVLVPALGLLVHVASKERDNALVEVRSKMQYLARLAGAEESQIIRDTQQLLQQLAQTPEARGEMSRAACDEMMARQIKLDPHYDNLGVIGLDGIRVCSVLPSEQSVDLSGRTYFKRAVETQAFSVGDYQLGVSSSNAAVGFGYPILDANRELRGVAFAKLNIKWLGKSLVREQIPPDASLTVVDSNGTILARFPDAEAQTGQPIAQSGLNAMLAHGGSGTFEGIGADGIRRVWGFVPLHQAASGILFVRVGLPVDAAYAGINRAFHGDLLLIAAAALLLMAAAWIGGERLVMRPVRRFTEAARHLGKGDLTARTGLPHGSDEFGQLARVFDGMAASIQSEGAALARLMTQEKEANEKLVAGIGALERLNREATQLSRMSQLLQACQNMEEVFAAIVHSGQLLFPADVATLYMMRASRDHLEYKAGWGGTGAHEALLAPESCWALRHGQIYHFDPMHKGLPCKHVGIEATQAPYVCVPLVAQSDILGLLHIRFHAQRSGEAAAKVKSRLQLVTTFAAKVGLALANLQLRHELKEQSIRDPLTGLYNRRFLEESLERELARSQRRKMPLAVLMADIDHFKRFNDTHGHSAGDTVLRDVAHILKSHIRGSDIACRLGGEEFTVVLPESTLDAARDKAESLRLAIASLELKHEGQPLGMITMSFGLAVFPEHGSDSAALLRAADLALYRAKDEGRNRVEIARPGDFGRHTERAWRAA